jgi:tRNA-Thr(GGU) m(6)t(6)A37 methyltransferase TsaA
MEYTIQQIGTIYSPYSTKEVCPVQGQAAPDGQGRVEVFPEYEEALETIETFSHIFLFYRFDQAGEIQLSRPAFLDDAPHGIFASRHPCRPNSIGMSIVRLEARKGNILEVSEIDMLDKTPLLDIKPYVPKFDYRPDAGNGWVAGKEWRDKPEGRE